jgi:hypothetical protein
MPGDVPGFRRHAEHRIGRLAVDGVVVLAAEEIVVHARGVRPARINVRRSESPIDHDR